jgi:hypothetical protein
MTTSMKVLRAQVVQTILLAVLSPPLPLAAVEAGVTAQGKPWGVTYLQGPIMVTRGKKKRVRPLAPGSKLKVKVDQEGIVCEAKKTVVLSIHAADVTEVSYDDTTQRVAKAVLRGMLSSGGSCYPPEGCGAMVMAGLMAAAITAPFKYTDHFVEIAWQQEDQKDEEQSIVLKVDKHDYGSFLAALENATGKQWKDLAQAKRIAHQAIKNGSCEQPAFAGSDLAVPLGNIKARQGELNVAASCGFRIAGSKFTPSGGLTAMMQKEATPPDVYQYVVLHALRTSTMQKQLNQAGTQGFRLRQDLLMPGQAGLLSLIMEKPPGAAQQRYEYLYYLTSRRSSLEKKIEQGRANGYEVTVREPFGGSHILILEKPAAANEATPRTADEPGQSIDGPDALNPR